ncbi:MAG TPA: hypothetical protein DEP62_00995 [Flavobacteriales bacterium]|nr:hypothetical protein [Flavobacteriales bacterium]
MRTAPHLPATGWMFTTMTVGVLVWSLVCPAPCSAQQNLPGYMSVKKGWFTDGSKIILDGQTYRPSRAADLCAACWEARDHFEHARRLRVRSFILANLGLVESVVGALRLEDARAVGTAHAAVGGVFMTWAAEREAKVRREVAAAVAAYNRCKLHETF